MNETNERSGVAAGSADGGRDILERPQDYDRHCSDADIDEAADEIKRLREAIRRLADQDATLSVCEGNVTVEMDAALTDEQREAVEACAVLADKTDLMVSGFGGQWKLRAATLRGLLERLGKAGP